MNNIAIIGAGWLGLPLAQRLTYLNKPVFATRTSKERLIELEDLSLPCFTLCLDSHISTADPLITTQFQDRDIQTIIGVFPPGFRKGEGAAYAIRWQSLINSAIKAGIKKIIMVSSTSVYPNTNKTMNENDASLSLAKDNDHFSENARTLLIAEQSLIDSGLEYAILRCSGLFGPNRHPARFVSKMRSISEVAPVNMVHIDDVINAILFGITEIHNQVINVTSPNTVTKCEFYQQAIHYYHETLTLPIRNREPAKKISPEKIIQLGFSFTYNNVVDGLKHC